MKSGCGQMLSGMNVRNLVFRKVLFKIASHVLEKAENANYCQTLDALGSWFRSLWNINFAEHVRQLDSRFVALNRK
jgi:hypothetical protein